MKMRWAKMRTYALLTNVIITRIKKLHAAYSLSKVVNGKAQKQQKIQMLINYMREIYTLAH